MKQLANTLFVTTPDAYLALDGENVVILKKDTELRRVPLHNLEGIIAFGYTGVALHLKSKKIAFEIRKNQSV